MADTRFTALGLAGSGKTCYILGMYYEMVTGKGFTLTTSHETASMLEDWMDKLDYETGADRFPEGTGLKEILNYEFDLNYQSQKIMSFDWMDYGGRTLREKEKNPEAFAKLKKSIKESTALYIFVNGKLFCDEDTERKMKNVKRECGRIINPFLDDFIKEKGSQLPPVVFVITKSDLCKHYIKNNKEIYDVLHESFSSVLDRKNNRCYITNVSLGKEIEEDGEADPINIQIPFFIGIYHEFFNACNYIKKKINNQISESKSSISSSNSEISYQRGRWFFTNYDKISRAEGNINEQKKKIKENEEYLKGIRKLLLCVAAELKRLSDNFVLIDGGREVDFSVDEVYDF